MGSPNLSSQASWRIARFGIFELDIAAGELRKSGMRLKLQDQPLQILVMLLKTPGEIVTREALRDTLWPADTFVEFDHSLNTAVKKLRQALGDDADNPRFIETIPRKGYKFIAPVQFDAERAVQASEPVSPVESEPALETAASEAKSRRHLWWFAAGGVLMLIVIAVLLYLVPINSSHPASAVSFKPLTWYPGDEMTPSLSPDNTRVAFAWHKENDPSMHIYVKVIGTEEPVAITTGNTLNAFPAWSPDGRFIAFRRLCVPLIRQIQLTNVQSCDETATGIFLIPSVGGPERLLHATTPIAAEGQLSFSPDGKRLLFADMDKGRWTIFSLSLDDLTVHRLTDPVTASGDTEPAFSPDGKWIAFSRDTKDAPNVYVMPAEGGSPRAVTHWSENPILAGLSWTADSKSVVYGGISLWRVRVSDGSRQQISNAMFSFSPYVQGNQLVYSESTWIENIFRIEIDGLKLKEIKPLITSSRIDQSAQYSADGKTLTFQSARSGAFEVYRANADGSNQMQLTRSNGGLSGTPSFTPDGKWIVFDSRPKGNADIMAVSPEGGSPRFLTTDSTNEVVPSVSHDGRWLYFASDRSGAFNIWKQPLEGGPATQLTFQGGFAPRESTDRHWIYYAKGVNEGGIWRVPVSGGKEEFVVPNPDGYWGFFALGSQGIYLVNGEGFSPSTLSYFDFASRKVTKISELPKSINGGSPGMGISPDGKILTMTMVASRNSDIVLGSGL